MPRASDAVGEVGNAPPTEGAAREMSQHAPQAPRGIEAAAASGSERRLEQAARIQGLACAKRCAGHSETLAASECLSWLLEQACPEVSGVGRAIRARGL